MSKQRIVPVDQELTFSPDEIIVSKTDKTGRILYANDVFCRLAEMQTADVLGQPHSIIRHPDMPRAIFKLLWDSIGAGREIFALIKNMSATGKYYWVVAHVTPSSDSAGNVLGYHSNRRSPARAAVQEIIPLYRELKAEEARHEDRRAGLEASFALLQSKLKAAGKSYDEFIWGVGGSSV